MKALASFLVLSSFALFATVSLAADAPAAVDGPKNEQGLTAAIVVNTATYTLDPTQTGDEFKAMLEKAKNPRNNVRLPKPPVIDLTLRLTNTTDKPITISLGGDDSQMQLKLEGPGAVMLEPAVAMTMEFRTGTPVTIAPGKTHEIKITSLSSGMRGISQVAFWTDPGDYTLTATLLYPMDDKQTKVVSAPAKLKLEAMKEGK